MKNIVKALSLKAQEGDQKSIYILAMIYLKGLFGVSPYPEEGHFWLSKIYPANKDWLKDE